MINKFKMNFHYIEILKKGSINFIFQIIGIGLGYLFIYMLAKYFNAEGVGLFSLTYSVLTIFLLFAKFGFDLAIVKFVSEYKDDFSKLKDLYIKTLFFLIPLNILLISIMFFLSKYIATYIFHNEEITKYLKLFSILLFPITLRFINANFLRGLKFIAEYSFIQSISVYLFSVSILFITVNFLNYNTLDLFVAYFLGVLIAFFISFWFLIKKINFFRISRDYFFNLKTLIKVAFSMLLANSLMLVITTSDSIILGYFTSSKDVGIYNIVIKIAIATSIFMTAIMSIVSSKLIELNKENKLPQTMQFVNTIIFSLSGIIIIFIFLFKEKILMLFGKEFIAGSVALSLLLFGRLIESMSGTGNYILQILGYENIVRNIMFIAALLNIFLNFILIPKYGINGAAFASMTSIIFWNFMYIFYIKQKLGFWNLPYLLRLKNGK